MTDTPRTDSMRGFHDLDTAVDAEFSEQLERENNELVRLGNALCEWCEAQADQPLQYFCTDQMRTLKQDIKNWKKATE